MSMSTSRATVLKTIKTEKEWIQLPLADRQRHLQILKETYVNLVKIYMENVKRRKLLLASQQVL
jgi:hypothetical protein